MYQIHHSRPDPNDSVAKQEIQQWANYSLDPKGYFCLDKASFFIDDPLFFLTITQS